MILWTRLGSTEGHQPDHEGFAPARLIGLWPEAGVCLCVDGTMTDLRAGARDLVRTAVAQRRQRTPLAA